MDEPKRARSWKRRIQPRIDLTKDAPVLYSTDEPCLSLLLESGKVACPSLLGPRNAATRPVCSQGAPNGS